MHVTARQAGNYLLARKVHNVVGITGDPRMLILKSSTPFRVSVCCSRRVSSVLCRFVPDISFWSARFVRVVYLTVNNKICGKYALLATSLAAPRRLHLLATKPTHCTRRPIMLA